MSEETEIAFKVSLKVKTGLDGKTEWRKYLVVTFSFGEALKKAVEYCERNEGGVILEGFVYLNDEGVLIL